MRLLKECQEKKRAIKNNLLTVQNFEGMGSNFNASVSKISYKGTNHSSLGVEQIEFSQNAGNQEGPLKSFRTNLSTERPQNNNHFKVLSSVRTSHLRKISQESAPRIPLIYDLYENSINQNSREELSKKVINFIDRLV